ncbi:porin [Rhizobium dioscoreae]|uniref:Porin n=2 Tax=Rhizobium TaxID=379 RepID=A0ABQ0Z3C1_9HYPH|nr:MULTISPECIES: porin [Rhizobium]MCZ3375139.1 porin [Rhizobium sp. AG207R]TWB20232.1 porin-like protein [Rhizobium sp. ERR1071]GES44700.1 porin [Rhizobium dioscoreae]GES49970.1 porin [Rhizobium dioscoreae]GLU82270.1 porin [Rhizobium sp. NBRC 114257]
MNIKSLLLGSAAALVAVSGAHAADAIVAAEPEPLEYVRICDAFGAGYFFIPGTETCLKIGGKVRTEGQWYDAYNPNSRLGTLWHTRAELNVNTATDTEYGPLKTETIIRWDWNDGNATKTNLLWAYISLGGFTVGKTDSQFNVFTGYAGDVINDDVVYDGPYELNQITYNYDAGNGFTAVISLEDSNSGTGATGSNGEDSSDHYAPDVVAGVGYKAGAWGFKVVGGYDSIVEEGAVKARVDADFGAFSAFLMGGWNTDGDKLNKYAGSNGAGDAAGIGWGDWAVWGGVGVPINEKLKWNLQLAYTDSKIFAATTNVKWNPVKNLLIEPEVSYTNWDSINQDQWAGILRFERTF